MNFPNMNAGIYFLVVLIALSGYIGIRTVEWLISLL